MVIDYIQAINRYTYLDAYSFLRIDQGIQRISQFGEFDPKSASHQIPIKNEENIRRSRLVAS